MFCPFLTASGAYTVDGSGVARVGTLADLQAALADDAVSTVVLTQTITIDSDTEIQPESDRKTIQVEKPFLPDSGQVRIETSGSSVQIVEPADGKYSTYKLFEVKAGVKATFRNLTLMGGFTGSRTNPDNASVGGIDNYGHLDMEDVDMLRTGTAVLNRPGARAQLVSCNIVRNANWFGGGILNFSERVGTSDEYVNGGYLVMDNCSLTENESLGPAHGGGAAENQGHMYLNNCVVANNASTEIGGGINNCKGGKLFVMNSTFTGNITTSAEYETMAGGAIGNAGGASHVHIVNTILAYNGYDDGESVVPSSLGRYNESEDVHCTLIHSSYDALAGLPQIDTTGTTKEYEDIFANVENIGIIAAGSDSENGETSAFDHPLVTSVDGKESWALAPTMSAQPADHYIFRNSVTTYFDYSSLFSENPVIGMAFSTNGVAVALGEDVTVPADLAGSEVTLAFGDASRKPVNFIGSGAVTVESGEEEIDDVKLFWVQLGKFTGGRVSGVTVYKDSYRSNTVITVHGMPDSAHYLDGWKLNDELVPDSAQQYIFSFAVTTNIIVTPVFTPVETKIIRVRQRYPWNNLVDIDYSVAEKDAIDYRLVFIATWTDKDGVEQMLQLKSFVKNAGRNEAGRFEEQRLGWKEDLRKAGEHRVTWDSAKDGVRLKDTQIRFRLLACEGDER